MVLGEPDWAEFVAKIEAAPTVGVGAPTLVETGLVLGGRIGGDPIDLVLGAVARSHAVVTEFGPDHWREALSAWQRFGKGRHPAALNFGDCLSYAVARVAGEPLLAKGNDFRQTDIELA
jgi:ribonuclease VapC